MTAHFRTRGVQSVSAAPAAPAATAILNELTDAIATFKGKNEDEVRSLQNSIDRLNGDIAAMRVGGGTGSAGDQLGTPLAVRRAKDAMASFVRTGKSIAPQAGMSSGSSPDGGYLVDPFSAMTFAQSRKTFRL